MRRYTEDQWEDARQDAYKLFARTFGDVLVNIDEDELSFPVSRPGVDRLILQNAEAVLHHFGFLATTHWALRDGDDAAEEDQAGRDYRVSPLRGRVPEEVEAAA